MPVPQPASSSFDPERLARLAEIERWHFWFKGRQVIVEQLLEKYLANKPGLLDIGCGTGFGDELLRQKGYATAGLDVRPEGLRAFRQRSTEALLVQADATHLPIADLAFQSSIMLDVLEHLDEGVVLKEVCRILKPGGVVIISVPAIPWLWSYRDRAAGHRRRYSRSHLTKVLNDAGLEVMEFRHYQFFLLPGAILSRLLGRKDFRLRDMEEQPRPILNKVLTWINRTEAGLSNAIAWPAGTSLLAVGRK